MNDIEFRKAADTFFGVKALKADQLALSVAAFNGQNIFSVLPTGYGKTICYQLPAIIDSGVAVIISPLLALMREQVGRLLSLGIGAARLGSDMSHDESEHNIEKYFSPKCRIIYLSPEKLASRDVQIMLQQKKPSRIVIDEAHCISEWGHDFRPAYRQIGALAARLGNVPLSAFTATATPKVQSDIKAQLFGGNTDVFEIIKPPVRTNIRLQFSAKTAPREQLLSYLEARQNHAGIIYAATRHKTQVLAQAIDEAWPGTVAAYHAGLETKERARIESAFQDDRISFVVATSAFGMGIDKSDIRFVIHADMPGTIAAYMQEIGRAGRDSDPAEAFCLYGRDDYAIRQNQIEQADIEKDIRALRAGDLETMRDLPFAPCYWQSVARYFGHSTPACGNCGGCLGAHAETTLPQKKAYILPHDITARIEKLKKWRRRMAKRKACPDHFILPTQVIETIAFENPKDLDALAAISGMGAFRLKTYGADILAALGHDVTELDGYGVKRAQRKTTDLAATLQMQAVALRTGESGLDVPLDCSANLIDRIISARPRTHEELAKIPQMSKSRMARFGDVFLSTLSAYYDRRG